MIVPSEVQKLKGDITQGISSCLAVAKYFPAFLEAIRYRVEGTGVDDQARELGLNS
jgi:hypothetical protein